MNHLRALLALTLVTLLVAGAAAQDGKKKRAKPVKLNAVSQVMVRHDRIQQALKKLEMTEEQEAQLKKLHEATQPKISESMKKVAEIIGMEKIKGVQKVADEAKEAGKNARQIAIAVEASLKLTDEQKKKLAEPGEEIAKLQRQMMKKVNGMLTDEQKKKLAAELAPRGKGAQKKKK